MGFAHEFYTIYAATSNSTSALQSSPVKRGEYVDEVGGAGVFVTRSLDISEFKLWLDHVLEYITDDRKIVAKEILKEVKEKTDFLLEVS